MSFQSLTEKYLAHHESSEVLENGGILRDSPATEDDPAPVTALDRFHWEFFSDEDGGGIAILDRRLPADGYSTWRTRSIAICWCVQTANKIVAALNGAVR